MPVDVASESGAHIGRKSLIASEVALTIVPGAPHLFSEPGAMDAVVDLAARWFERYLVPEAPMSAMINGKHSAK